MSAQSRSFHALTVNEGRFCEVHLCPCRSDPERYQNTQQLPAQGDFRVFCTSGLYHSDFAFRYFITATHLYTDVMFMCKMAN